MIVVTFNSVVDHGSEWTPIQSCLRAAGSINEDEDCTIDAAAERKIVELLLAQEGDMLQDQMPVLLNHYGWSEISITSMLRSALRDGVPEKLGWTLGEFLSNVLRVRRPALWPLASEGASAECVFIAP